MNKWIYGITVLFFACNSPDKKELVIKNLLKDSLSLSEIKLQINEIKEQRKKQIKRDLSVQPYIWDTLMDCNYDGYKDLIFESYFNYPKAGFAFQNSLFDIYYYNSTKKQFIAGEKNIINASFNFKDSSIFEAASDGSHQRVLLKKFRNKKWQNILEANAEYIVTNDSTGELKLQFSQINYLSNDTTRQIIEKEHLLLTGEWPKNIFPYKIPPTLHWYQK